ncbi:hypothetical protein [Faecalibacillus intestinalis]|uniref:hypothetical protein n=1 Tax=Faecalibacillus intestinalis TaxID=1982626 RepID=UPI0039969FC9
MQDKKEKTCIFEYIYFARGDSVIDGISVHHSRKEAGRLLAKYHPVDGDVVIGVPDSGIDAALGYSQESKIPYEIGFIKNNILDEHLFRQDSLQDLIKLKSN